MQPESLRRESVHQNHIGFLVRRQRLKRNPSKHQWKRDPHGEEASPEKKLVHPPAQRRPTADKCLRRQMGYCELNEPNRSPEDSSLTEQLPTPFPVDARRRLIKPNAIVVDNTPG